MQSIFSSKLLCDQGQYESSKDERDANADLHMSLTTRTLIEQSNIDLSPCGNNAAALASFSGKEVALPRGIEPLFPD